MRRPGGKLRKNEEDIAGLKRKLNNKLAPTSSPQEWEVRSALCGGRVLWAVADNELAPDRRARGLVVATEF